MVVNRSDDMKKLVLLFLLLIVLAVSGCTLPVVIIDNTLSTWTRIPEAPEYTVEAPIPLSVGIILDVSPAYSTSYINIV